MDPNPLDIKPIGPASQYSHFVEFMHKQIAASMGVPASILVGDSCSYASVVARPRGLVWGSTEWFAKADALGDACCRDLERVARRLAPAGGNGVASPKSLSEKG